MCINIINGCSRGIKTILLEASEAIGDTVWDCYHLTALRLNFPDATIKQIIRNNRWAKDVLIPPKLNIQFVQPGSPESEDWDFRLSYIVHESYYQFKGHEPVKFPPLVIYRHQNPDNLSPMRAVPMIYAQFRNAFPGFKIPERPIMPDIAPYQDFPSGLKTQPLVTINTGSGRQQKEYPIEQWEAVAEGLYAHGFNIIYVGGAKDPKPQYKSENVINLVGEVDLRTTIALIRASAVHLAADTGTGHIAGAYRIPVVSLFGYYSYPAIGAPFGDDTIIRVLESHKGKEQPNPCMPPQDVIAATQSLHRFHTLRQRLEPQQTLKIISARSGQLAP